MSTLKLRPGILDTIRNLHGITSDEALARAAGVSHRTIVRVRTDGTQVQASLIAGLCTAFGYTPSDIVVAEPMPTTKEKTAA